MWAVKIPNVFILRQFRWKHSLNGPDFSLIRNRMKKWVIFDTMACQILPKYHISFLLFKVSVPWKFQMSWFCVSTNNWHSPKQEIFSLIRKEWKNESYLIQWDAKDFQNIKLVCLYSKSMSCKNSKCCHFASVQVKQIVSVARFALCVSPILMQNENVWNFHSSLTLSKGKLIWYSGSLWYAIVSNMTHFFILLGSEWKKKMACFEQYFLSELTQNEVIWNFHGSLSLSKWKLIWYSWSLWYAIVSNMTHFSILFGMREKMAFFNCGFYLYWCKMKTFEIFTTHWLWINGN